MTRSRTGGGDPVAGLLALSGAIAVIAGAYGAHGAHGDAAEWLRTGAQYGMIHAVAGLVALQAGRKGARGIAGLFLLGSAIFSGTLYAMALGGPRILGAVTPIGGLAMILGWMWLAVVLLRGR